MQLSSAIVDFYLFYDGPVDVQIRALLTRNSVYESKVTVKVETIFQANSDPYGKIN